MIDTFPCDDKDWLVAFLYDELDAAARRQVEDHLRICGACATEVESLRGVRRELSGWALPDAALGFELRPAEAVSTRAEVVRPARWWSPPAMPVWARAAAAVLVAAAGLGLANLQIRYGAEGLVVTTGWMPAAEVVRPAVSPAAASKEWQSALAALESSLRQEIEAGRQSAARPTTGPGARELDLQRMTHLIEQSERRQQRELAGRLAQFNRDLEVQRRTDLVRINQGMGQFEGRAGAEIQRQRQMIDYIMRVSAPPPQ
ncbi:MAG TPA: zf-HC2 domain-containing protein [Vicinamibacterales bacterium]|nr:zf-HC2 domain-containing protein [Vicinamibacterales bacterium]